MNCRKCKKDLPDGALYCCWCGTKQTVERKRRRSNGEGTVFKRGNKWAARYRSFTPYGKIDKYHGGFATKVEALEWLAHVNDMPRTDSDITFAALFEQWISRHADRVGKSTINCYKAAYKYFEPVWPYRFALLTTEQLQKCVDGCPCGPRTRENMKALCTCLYRYAREIGVTDNDYGQFIYVVHGEADEKRTFSRDELERLFAVADSVPYIDVVLILCYTGFRINEICAMNRESYDPQLRALFGGSKTDAGKNRVVPVADCILPFVEQHYSSAKPGGPLFSWDNGKRHRTNHLRDVMQAALNAVPEVRPLMPHECRHTFATLMKSADGSREDKKRLIGHASELMLEHYTHAGIEDLRAIIEQL